MTLRSIRKSCWCYYGPLLLANLTAFFLLNPTTVVLAQPIFYTAQSPQAFDALKFDDNANIQIFHEEDAYWVFERKANETIKKVGFIYYPGCYYDERAYAPVARKLAQDLGFTSFILDVPWSFSILSPFRADLVIRDYPEIDTWVVGGHGLGGMVASVYTQYRRVSVGIKGLALFSSYPFPLFNDLSWTDIKAISLWGSADGITKRIQWEDGAKQLPNDAKFVEIDGANYSQMAYLSTTQNGDGDPTISREAQQKVVFEELKELLARVEAEIPSDHH